MIYVYCIGWGKVSGHNMCVLYWVGKVSGHDVCVLYWVGESNDRKVSGHDVCVLGVAILLMFLRFGKCFECVTIFVLHFVNADYFLMGFVLLDL